MKIKISTFFKTKTNNQMGSKIIKVAQLSTLWLKEKMA
jgi:hypothetical protein